MATDARAKQIEEQTIDASGKRLGAVATQAARRSQGEGQVLTSLSLVPSMEVYEAFEVHWRNIGENLRVPGGT